MQKRMERRKEYSEKLKEILTPEQMRSAIARIFARKGEQVVNDNLKAFDLGYENIQ